MNNMMNQVNNVAAQGRYGDTMLMHVNPNEVKGLAQLGALSLNPSTGLPEAFSLRDILPIVASIAGGMFGGPMGAALGSGLTTAAVEGDLKKGLFAGLSSYALGSLLRGATAAGKAGQAGMQEISDSAVGAVADATPAVSDPNLLGGPMSGTLPDVSNASTTFLGAPPAEATSSFIPGAKDFYNTDAFGAGVDSIAGAGMEGAINPITGLPVDPISGLPTAPGTSFNFVDNPNFFPHPSGGYGPMGGPFPDVSNVGTTGFMGAPVVDAAAIGPGANVVSGINAGAAESAVADTVAGLTEEESKKLVADAVQRSMQEQAERQALNLPLTPDAVTSTDPNIFSDFSSIYESPGTINPVTGELENVGGFDFGTTMSNVNTAAMDPSFYVPGAVGFGGLGVMKSQEEYEAMLKQLELDEEKKRRQMYLDYPEAIPGTYITPLPSASGGITKFANGQSTNKAVPKKTSREIVRSMGVDETFADLHKIYKYHDEVQRQALNEKYANLFAETKGDIEARSKMRDERSKDFLKLEDQLNRIGKAKHGVATGGFRSSESEMKDILNLLDENKFLFDPKHSRYRFIEPKEMQEGGYTDPTDPDLSAGYNFSNIDFNDPSLFESNFFGAGMQYVPKREANPIPMGYMPGFMPEFNYFSNTNPAASDLQSGVDAGISNLGAADVPSAPVFSPTQSPSYQQFYGSAAQGVPQILDPTQQMNPFQVGPFVPPPPPPAPPIIPPDDGTPTPPPPPPPPDDDERYGDYRLGPISPVDKDPRGFGEPSSVPSGFFSKLGSIKGPGSEPSSVRSGFFRKIGATKEPFAPSGIEDNIMSNQIAIAGMEDSEFPVFKPESLEEQIARNKMIIDMLEKDERRMSPRRMKNGGKSGKTFPDLNKDGKVTKADILKGRGVFQEGGVTFTDQQILEDPITKNLIAFLLGEISDDSALNMFIDKYGTETFQRLRESVLKTVVPNAQVEGQIQGTNQGGMADDIDGMIGNKQPVAVSQDEFIVPADVVSSLGDGSSDAGADKLYRMMDRVRQAKNGGTTQPPEIKDSEVLPV